MPRAARKKSENALYHVMCRSISERDLFPCDEDKEYYLSLLKKYCEKCHCKVYAYCLMDNHVHIYIDPCGFDISTYMRHLNTAYVSYFNRRYKRHGHLFQGRFGSIIVDNDTYSLTLSAYIHNNAKDIPGYEGREELYKYSSYGIYTGKREDTIGIIDTEYILSFFSNVPKIAKQKYRLFVISMKDTGITKKIDENIIGAYTENIYRSEKKQIVRDMIPEELVEKVSKILGERAPETLRAKYSRDAGEFRAFAVYIMRTLCGYTYKSICEYIGNMSVSGISRLVNEGYELFKERERYRNAFKSLVQAA